MELEEAMGEDWLVEGMVTLTLRHKKTKNRRFVPPAKKMMPAWS
jgi:hypothetical protein